MPSSVPFVIVGNKCDIDHRVVSKEQGEALALKLNCKYIEASAKNDVNVAKVFETIAEEILDYEAKQAKEAEAEASITPRDRKSRKDKKKKCTLF